MDVTKYAAEPESYDILSEFQISDIFSKASITKAQCDDLAAQLLGGPVSATPIQGGNSYTVERKNVPKVVQFRSSQLDMAKLELAQQVYLNFVPQCMYHGILGSFYVYVWDRVPGSAFCRVRRKMFALDMNESHGLGQTVQDFARSVGSDNRDSVNSYLVAHSFLDTQITDKIIRFFALAWVNRSAILGPLPPGFKSIPRNPHMDP
ncbi:hypothetical protein BFJ66_g18281 [Fusarium oxysporum f. sp. cepae]|uniref:Uncharacterized protein n=1 Tax=Fusarium oxysporum f. sp. cepae TaxID=396571 RepID=A0A3L6N2L9_FUSOX|nr:hypothetical protein BFJ65_g14608 [Fusarium oxysporum f. sp. cepae]RKK12570.1 hypothetical protein BFJ67_g18090 [Fusarium oxysporum f. sp. cepae]RKK12587.1 hypothetical protein BFJ66_g18281 [Fusarium oxysporum f. sp. cepae]